MRQMKKLALNCSEMTISDAPEPLEVVLPLKGMDDQKDKDMLKVKLKEGTQLNTGHPLLPGVYSTVTGTVKRIESMLIGNTAVSAVRVAVSTEEKIDPSVKKDPEYLKKLPLDLLERLNRAGLGFRSELEKVKTVIVSAVDTDPFHNLYHQVLAERKETVVAGLALVRHLAGAEKVILAVPEPLYHLAADITGDWISIHKVPPFYPNGLPELLLDSVSKVYDVECHLFIGVERLCAAVDALQEGKPFTHKVVSVIDENGARNRRVRIGTPVRDLLKDTYLKDNDKVILGGVFRGTACFNLDMPVTEDTDSIYVQHSDKGEVNRDRNNQCMSCGACVRVCPVGLDVNLICRYAEFSIFEKCHEIGIASCIECGLCAYVCPSGRSLVQLIRLAKTEKPKEEEVGEAPMDEETPGTNNGKIGEEES